MKKHLIPSSSAYAIPGIFKRTGTIRDARDQVHRDLSQMDARSKMECVARIVSEVIGVPVSQIQAKGNYAPNAMCRQIISHICKCQIPGLSLVRIGFYLNRDHATILWAIRRAEDFLDTDQRFRDLYMKCLSRFDESQKVDKII